MSKGTVLIVEDQQGFRRVYHDVLASDGYDVLEAEDGEVGWAMIREKKPHVVLLDLGLPKLDGFEVLKRAKADPETKAIPIIIFSVLGEQKDVKKGLEMGASDYTVKGFYTPRQILSKIKNLMNQVEVKKSVNSYKLKVLETREDAAKLQAETGIAGYQCPQCDVDLVLEVFPDYVRNEGHWFTAHFVCPKCARPF
jgi:DNA-binding response OmpR family regulator